MKDKNKFLRMPKDKIKALQIGVIVASVLLALIGSVAIVGASQFLLQSWEVTDHYATACLKLEYVSSGTVRLYMYEPDGDLADDVYFFPEKHEDYIRLTFYTAAVPSAGTYKMEIYTYPKHLYIGERTFTFKGPKLEIVNVSIEGRKIEDFDYFDIDDLYFTVKNVGDLPIYPDCMHLHLGDKCQKGHGSAYWGDHCVMPNEERCFNVGDACTYGRKKPGIYQANATIGECARRRIYASKIFEIQIGDIPKETPTPTPIKPTQTPVTPLSPDTTSTLGFEAEKIASKYAYEGEYGKASGEIIYHNDKPYYVVGFFKEATDKYTGSVIVDVNSGEIVKDEDTAREIFYTVTFFNLEPVTYEELAGELVVIGDTQDVAKGMESMAEDFTDLAKEPGISSKLKREINDVASSYETLGNDVSKLADIEQECYDLRKQWLEEKDTKLAKDIISKYDEFILYISATLLPDFEKLMCDSITLFDTLISETTDPTKKASLEAEKQTMLTELTAMQQEFDQIKDELKSMKTEIIEGSADIHGVNWEIEKLKDHVSSFEATPTEPKNGVPGFDAIFGIAGLLAVAYLLRKRK